MLGRKRMGSGMMYLTIICNPVYMEKEIINRVNLWRDINYEKIKQRDSKCFPEIYNIFIENPTPCPYLSTLMEASMLIYTVASNDQSGIVKWVHYYQ